jgi:hypothetical protein
VNDKEFAVFGSCIDVSNGLPVHAGGPGLTLNMDGDHWIVSALDKSPIGMFQLLDIHGRILRTGTFNSGFGELDLAGLAPGAYVFRSDRLGSATLLH